MFDFITEFKRKVSNRKILTSFPTDCRFYWVYSFISYIGIGILFLILFQADAKIVFIAL